MEFYVFRDRIWQNETRSQVPTRAMNFLSRGNVAPTSSIKVHVTAYQISMERLSLHVFYSKGWWYDEGYINKIGIVKLKDDYVH